MDACRRPGIIVCKPCDPGYEQAAFVLEGFAAFMRIGHLSTFFPTHCAFPYYTLALARGMLASRADEHVVITEAHCPAEPRGGLTVAPTWRRGEDYVPAIVGEARRQRLDVLLVQYANDIFGDDHRMPRLLAELRAAGVTTVVNLHSVYPARARTRYVPGRDSQSFDRAVAAAAGSILVHTPRMRQDLQSHGIGAERVAVIPHGTLLQTPPDRSEARRSFGIPAGAKLVLFFGFIWPGKGIDFLLEVFAGVARRIPDAYLYVGGHTRKQVFYTRAYMAYLRARLRWLGIAGRSWLHGDYVADEDVPRLYAAADVVAMPYRQGYSSSSGVVHQAAGLDTLMMCSRILKFEEVGEAISPALLADYGDRKAWVDGLAKLLGDERLAEELRARVRRFAEETSWERVGAQHLALFDRLVEAK
jgi:glycosyltransferase involved in cell wall biosynthesis